MERAVARIDFGAVRANCARLKAELGDGAELCAVVKADGYGHGADACADAALAGGATRLAVATASEAEQIGRRLQHIPLLTMGALTAGGGRRRPLRWLGAGGLARGLPGAARRSRPRPRAAGPRPRQVRQRHGAARQPGPRARCWRWRGPAPRTPTSSWPASGPTSPPPTNPTRPSSTSSSSASRPVAAAVKAEFPASSPTPPTAPPSSATGALTSTWPAAASPIYGLDPFQRDPAARDLAPALSLRSYVADVKRFPRRRERRLRAAPGGRRRGPGSA